MEQTAPNGWTGGFALARAARGWLTVRPRACRDCPNDANLIPSLSFLFSGSPRFPPAKLGAFDEASPGCSLLHRTSDWHPKHIRKEVLKKIPSVRICLRVCVFCLLPFCLLLIAFWCWFMSFFFYAFCFLSSAVLALDCVQFPDLCCLRLFFVWCCFLFLAFFFVVSQLFVIFTFSYLPPVPCPHHDGLLHRSCCLQMGVAPPQPPRLTTARPFVPRHHVCMFFIVVLLFHFLFRIVFKFPQHTHHFASFPLIQQLP